MTPKIIPQEVIDEMKERLNYDPNTGVITWRESKSNYVKNGTECGTLKPSGYLVINFSKQLYRAHRVAWVMHYGKNPSTFLDHVNQDKTDNRIENLREASSSQNKCNITRRSDNKSGYRGISWDRFRNKWKVEVQIQGKSVRKRIADFDEAVGWVKQKQAELHGDFRPTHVVAGKPELTTTNIV